MISIRTIALTTTVSLALVLGCGAVAAEAAPVATTATGSSSSCTFPQHLLAAWKAMPAELRKDLKAAKALPRGAERRAKLASIRTKALDGGYGAGVEVRAQWLKDHKGDHLRPLPAALKADLKSMHADPRSKRVADAEAIAEKAISGAYGATIESFAKAVQSSTTWQSC